MTKNYNVACNPSFVGHPQEIICSLNQGKPISKHNSSPSITYEKSINKRNEQQKKAWSIKSVLGKGNLVHKATCARLVLTN